MDLRINNDSKMTIVTFILFTCLLLQRCTITRGSTHWVVTEDGRIQSQPDSVYNLRRPYDLVAFMKQEDRATMLNGLKKELLSRKDEIDRNEDRDTGLEQKFYKTNPDCIEAGKPLPEFDLYISTVLPLENKGIRPEEHIDVNGAPSSSPKAPDCTSFMGLDFSMHSFEHLEGMKARTNLSGTPELGLKNAITHRENVDDYGHLVYEALHKNKTSWILYNMAAFYWRIKGNPHQAVECVRRALHHSPRLQKDVALISLANILHRARFSNEAAILVHSALEVSKELNVNHFTLGNIYAVLGEYNKSIICFENTLKIQPDFEAASKRRYAVLCHSKLELALEAQHRSLQRTLKDLKDYQRKHDLYQMQSDKLLSEQVPHEVKVAQHFAYEQQKIRERSAQMDEYCRMVDRNGKQVLLCTWSRRLPKLDFDFAFLDEDATEGQGEEKNDPSGEAKKSKSSESTVDYSLPVRAPLYSKYKKYKPTESDSYTLENWPDKEECDSLVKKVPDPRNQTTVYLSPENKGFEVKKLLTEAQGLAEGGEHPLPWYPPVCVPLMELDEGNPLVYDHLKSVSYAERSRIPLKYNDPSMRKVLLSHVNGGLITEEEVGQRILTALKKNIGPPWILYNLAGLYWRIIGNNFHGIECLRRSIFLTPPQYKDIPLVNLANIFYRYGRYDDAITIMRDAVEVSDVEPSTHFLMAHLLWTTRNYTGAGHHYKEALAADPAYQGALDSLRAMKCFLKFHHAAQSAAPQESPADSVSNNCQQKGAETESRVICKTENNEEKCIIETRSRNRVADCNGQCTQTCTISPVKLDGCSGEMNIENAIIGHCSGKGGKPFSSDQEDILFSGDFTSRLDEVSDYYEKKGLCQGDECSHLRVQCLLPMTTHAGLIAHVITPPKLFVRPVAFHASQCLQHSGPKPHTKLEYVEGVLKQKLIFLQVAPSEMEVNAEDCIIFNDGTRSSGCSREEFRTYFEGRRSVDFPSISRMTVQNKIGDLDRDIQTLRQKMSDGGGDLFPLSQDYLSDEKQREAEPVENYDRPYVPKSIAPPLPPPSITPYPSHLLPDTTLHIKERAHLPMSKSQCEKNSGKTVFDRYESTWVLFTSKDIDIKDHIDFSSVIKQTGEKPLCPSEEASPVLAFDHLPGVSARSEVNMNAEIKLTETFKTLSGQPSTIDIVKAQIIDAMEENSTSWIAYHLASLYWRIEGNAENAIDCLRVALTFAPHAYRDVPLIGLANVLQQMSYTNDAIVVTNAALYVSPGTIESLYTMANVNANKGFWDQTVMYLQAILAKLPGFLHAEYKLKEIYCEELSSPDVFNS